MIYNYALLGLLAFIVGLLAIIFFERLDRETPLNVEIPIIVSMSIAVVGIVFMIFCGVIYILDRFYWQ